MGESTTEISFANKLNKQITIYPKHRFSTPSSKAHKRLIHLARMFYRWGSFVYRWRWFVLILSLGLLVITPVNIAQGLDLDSRISHINSDSEKADNLTTSEIPKSQGSSFTLIFQSDTLKATDSAFQQDVEYSLKPLRTDSRVKSIDTPYNSQNTALIGKDHRSILAIVNIKDSSDISRSYYQDLRNEVSSNQLKITATGNLAINHDFDTHLESGLQRAEKISLPIVLILLLLVFATVVAGVIPLLIGGVTIVTALAGVYLMSHHISTSQYTINIVTLIGLGVSIDYSLFIVSRFKEELSKNALYPDKIARSISTAIGTAGKTITFSGIAVGIGLSALLFYQGTFLSSMGIAGSIVVAAAIFYALTTLPALLSILGPSVNRLQIPLPKNNLQQRLWYTLAEWVMDHPWWTLIPAAALLIAAAYPVLSMRIASSSVDALPPDAESRIGLNILKSNFTGQELTDIPVVVHFDTNPLTKENIDYLYDLNSHLAKIKNVYDVQSPFSLNPSYTKQDYEKLLDSVDQLPLATRTQLSQSIGSDIVILNVQTSFSATSDEARNLVKDIRAIPPKSGTQTLVAGFTASDIDFLNYIFDRSIYAAAFIIFATLLIIFAMLRSVILPIKAVIMNLLSISAAFGLMTFIFQQGHFDKLLNFTPQSIDPSIPVLLFCIVFGLSMDYEVLLLSRMREEYQNTHDNRQAVSQGLQKSAVLITGAGLIMISVFAAFGTADVVIIKAIGLGMAVAVLVDMTIVRALIVPAIMRLLGNINWLPNHGKTI